VTAALIAELAGAEGITVPPARRPPAHPGPGRRTAAPGDCHKLNIEMAATPEMVGIACRVKPDR